MIPQIPGAADRAAKRARMPSATYALDIEAKRIVRRIDGMDAIRQMIAKALMTERYACAIYDGNYGVGLEKYVGEDFEYVEADAGREIREALLADDRVTAVDNFQFTRSDLNGLTVAFDAHSQEGAERMEVSIRV